MQKSFKPNQFMTHFEFQAAVLNWFDQNGRKDLPWQVDSSPYKVWISETMLQQTQVATVIPYFNRFMERFGDVDKLACAVEDDVLKYWAGLGYYARARNLHKTARIVSSNGEMPSDLEALCALPGIGRSTAGAILSLGFNIKAPILDGNVKRVLSRFIGLDIWPNEPQALKKLWAISEHYTPVSRVADYNQAMMDLGAMVCTKSTPGCAVCPLNQACLAFKFDKTALIPLSRPKRDLAVRRCFMLAIQNPQGEFFLQKRPASGIWGGLWSLPEFEHESELTEWCLSNKVSRLVHLNERRHNFTHLRLDFTPVMAFTALPVQNIEGSFKRAMASALPAPIEKLLNDINGDRPSKGS